MTRKEYMEKLENGLKGYDEEFAADILEDYKRHFDEAEKDGRSEESVCDELGDVDDFIRDIPDEFKKLVEDKEDKQNKGKKYTDEFGRIVNAAGKIVTDVADTLGSAFSKLGDMIDKAVNDSKGSNQDDDEETETKENVDLTDAETDDECVQNPLVLGSFPGITKFSLSLVYANIEIQTQDAENELTVSLSRPLTKKERMYLKTSVSTDEGSLKIEQELKDKIQAGFSQHTPITYYISLPTGCKNISLSTVSGGIDILCPISADKCKLNAVSGNINVAEGIEADKVSVNTVSGVVNVSNIVSAEELNLNTVSGAVKVVCGAKRISVNTVSGAIKVSFTDVCSGKIDTVSGTVKIKLLTDAGLDIKASSMSGTLKINTDKRIVWDNDDENTVFLGFRKGSRSAVFGDGGIKLKTSSVSSSVKVYDFGMEDE